ncbi:FAD-dependent oxidoreductase [Bradyrhizobium roseum]|uniref:FAD-dependent oxidoreductase n=1 Tax=Bradyrhizobium roseum TaxID=3056648 RepID=UPI002A4E2BF2|nr:FAD-dependent oxidoreductase [Bradyrhizobium roseus]
MHDRPSAASDKAASDQVKTRVLVVGAGPVGLTLAMDLASRGISVTVVETRAPGDRRA